LWETNDTNAIRTPESVLYDAGRARIYVACMGQFGKPGDGYIALLSPSGAIQNKQFTAGLDDPKGMALSNDVLWVADLTQLVCIDPRTGEVLKRIAVPGATFLNDVTADRDGNIYVSDTRSNRIHKISPAGVPAIWAAADSLGGPNGVFALQNQLYLASAGAGIFSVWDAASAIRKQVLAKGMPRADGIVYLDPHNGFIVSTWTGIVYHISPNGGQVQLLDLAKVKKNTADIDWIPQAGTLLIPTFFGHSVAAYKVEGL
jgi:sugar lactone lactonase YvrE